MCSSVAFVCLADVIATSYPSIHIISRLSAGLLESNNGHLEVVGIDSQAGLCRTKSINKDTSFERKLNISTLGVALQMFISQHSITLMKYWLSRKGWQ